MMFHAFAKTVDAGCPMGFDKPQRVPAGHNPTINGRVAPKGYLEAFEKIDLNAVKDDLKALFVDSKDFWPADYGTYAPLMIRLAWHSAGSFRVSDGRGGADGGRMRFDPERSWDDNVNLDKARTLLEPIKLKYGVGLSWGDLSVLAGDAAIESMGGPTVGFCGGRIDDSTGFWSERLGPNALQEKVEPCPEPPCEFQAATELGLIYVNPEGPLINGVRVVDPAVSAPMVRETFRRMGMNDTETVALVGGGHAFGKTHGACPAGAGPSPMEQPENPWPGNCGSGVGVDTAGSGFEGPWTSNPIKWSNEYFHNLLEYDWEEHTGAGGKQQWRATNVDRKRAPQVNTTDISVELMMTTADLSLKYDPTGSYQEISRKFKDEPAYLDMQFSEAWYKLMTRDMGPRERCLGSLVPEAREFQNPLPMPPSKLADFEKVKKMIKMRMKPAMGESDVSMYYDTYDGMTNYGPLFIRLAWRCAATHRVTDYTGGCNGARIRLAPQKDWPINAGLDMALDVLEPIKNEFGDELSWADLIVLAGNTALEDLGSKKLPFCGGRTDATAAGSAGVMEPKLDDAIDNDLDDLQEAALLLGLSPREFTALMGRRSVGTFKRQGYMGSADGTPLQLDVGYYKELISKDWKMYTVPESSKEMYKADDSYILRSDFLLTLEPEFLTAAQDFATDQDMWKDEFAAAWTKVMNADRFDGPVGSLCEPYISQEELDMMPGSKGDGDKETVFLVTTLVFALLFCISLITNIATHFCKPPSKEEKGVEMFPKPPRKTDDDQGQQSSPRVASRV